MKKIYFLPILALLAGCSSVNDVDRRPASEIAFVKEFVAADSTYEAQINDLAKKESFEKSAKKLTDFVDNTLKGKIENWEVVMLEVEPHEASTDATFIISKEPNSVEEQYSQYNSITLVSESIKDERLLSVLKTLAPNEIVLVSGTLGAEKDENGFLVLETALNPEPNKGRELESPSFYFNLTDVKKKPVEKL